MTARSAGRRSVSVLDPGPLTTVQDAGRPGLAHLGIGRSGAADLASYRLANRLVGNVETDATLEITLGGLVLRAECDLLIAVTGAPCPLRAGGIDYGINTPVSLRAGGIIVLGTPAAGLRSYLAVRGGIRVPPVLGSRSTDTLSEIGPGPLRVGDVLPVGVPYGDQPSLDVAAVAAPENETLTLSVRVGPRDDWFTPASVQDLLSRPYEVTAKSNRVAMRLSGPSLARTRFDELPSEGMVTGSLQVSADGQPTLFLVDHPVTGGYPVIAVVERPDLDRAAQARPGQHVRFHGIAPRR